MPSTRTRPGACTTRLPCRRPARRCGRGGGGGARPAAANFNPRTEDKVDTKNPERGPMLIVSGEQDHTVPHVLAYAAYKHQLKNPGITEFVEIPGRGHALTIDDGWQEVAETALTFVRRFT